MIYIKDASDIQIWCDYQEEILQTSADFFLRLRFANLSSFTLAVNNYGDTTSWGDGIGCGSGDGSGRGDGYGNSYGSGYGFGSSGNNSGDGEGIGYGYGKGNGDVVVSSTS